MSWKADLPRARLACAWCPGIAVGALWLAIEGETGEDLIQGTLLHEQWKGKSAANKRVCWKKYCGLGLVWTVL